MSQSYVWYKAEDRFCWVYEELKIHSIGYIVQSQIIIGEVSECMYCEELLVHITKEGDISPV